MGFMKKKYIGTNEYLAGFILGNVQIFDETSYKKFQSLETSWLVIKMLTLLWNLTGSLAAVLARHVLNSIVIGKILSILSKECYCVIANP